MNSSQKIALATLFAIGILIGTSSMAQKKVDSADACFHDELLDHLVGKWRVTSIAHHYSSTATIEAKWIMRHQHLNIHFKGNEEIPWIHGPMEFDYFIGYTHSRKRYVVHGISVFGNDDEDGFWYGSKNGNEIQLIQRPKADTDSSTGKYNVQRITWIPASNTWLIVSREVNAGVESEPFLEMKLVSVKSVAKNFRDCPFCPEMVVIPGGNFMMGSPQNEPNRQDKTNGEPVEGPQRQVNIRSFAAGKFDITKAEWAAFVISTKRKPGGDCGWSGLPGQDTLQPWLPLKNANWNHVSFAQDSSHPVVCISWNDAKDYAAWLSKKTGHVYRLLSEAEWEYAARAGTSTPYYWGTEASHEFANYGHDSSNGTGLAVGRDKWLFTSPVGSFPANSFGLYDMGGNVWQWVEDEFSTSYQGLPTDGSAFKKEGLIDSTGKYPWMINKKSNAYHMVRGGGYADSPGLLRSAFRNWGAIPAAMKPDLSRSAGGGFRVARNL